MIQFQLCSKFSLFKIDLFSLVRSGRSTVLSIRTLSEFPSDKNITLDSAVNTSSSRLFELLLFGVLVFLLTTARDDLHIITSTLT